MNSQSIMKKFNEFLTLNKIPILFLIFVTIWLRLANLGYSDYQGDEIKALLRPAEGQTVTEFLFNQRKGPVQFLITYTTSFVDPTFLNQFLFRIPFALAGILAIYFFYKLVKLHFNEKIAIYSALFMSINGLFVAFSRIVQYQSVTILFFILALYFFSLTIKNPKWEIKGWYYGMIFWALSILTHFDGGFIAPFVLYLLYRWFQQSSLDKQTKIKHIILSSLIFLVLLASFFIPYVSNVSDATKDYWLNRLEGSGGKISSSIITFKAYNPKLIFYIFTGLVLVSLSKFKKTWPILLWAAFPLFVWEIITEIPGTHIHNYLIPMTILAAFGITVVEKFMIKLFKNDLGKKLNIFGLSVMFLFIFYASHKVFIDHNVEYPWEPEKFLVWTIPKPNAIFHLSLFGFPYNRGWEEIMTYVSENNDGHFSTNERPSIPRFYIGLHKNSDDAGPYVSIVNPQSFADELLQEKAKYWGENHAPDKIISRDGEVVARIYLMEPGDLSSIQERGY